MKVIFTTDNLPASIAIRVLTASTWHHCAVVIGQEVIEASGLHGVRKVPLDEFKSRGNWAIYDIHVADDWAANNWLYQQLGKPYDWLGVFGLMLSRRWQNEKRWYCSELVAAAASAGGTEIVRSNLKGVTPRDLWVLPCKAIKGAA